MKNKFCTYCGNPLLEDQLVCPECGKAVKTSLKGETIFVSPVEPKKEATSKKTHKENETQQTEEQPIHCKEELKPEPLPEPEPEPVAESELLVEKLVKIPEPIKSKKLKRVILTLTSITAAYLLFLLVWNTYFAIILYSSEGIGYVQWRLSFSFISLGGIVCCILSFILSKNKIALLILPFISIACALVADLLGSYYLTLFISDALLATFFISLIPVNIIRFKALKAARQENHYE